MNKRLGEKDMAKRAAVTALMSRGLMNKEIAEELCISERAVKWYVSEIYRKHGFFGAGSRWKFIAAELARGRKNQRV